MMKRALLPVLSLVVLCLLLEVVLRTTHLFNARLSWTEPDREIGWRFTPGREYWFSGENDHAITGRINSLGCRDRERTAQKPARVRRMAVLGDSFVEAFQVELDSTFVAITERSLNAHGHGEWEVMNFGRSGMTQAEELIVLERDILPLAPDVVLLVFAPVNDIADISPATAPDTGRPFFRRVSSDSLTLDLSFAERRSFRMREALNPFKQRSALISLALERYNGASPRARDTTHRRGASRRRDDARTVAVHGASGFGICRELRPLQAAHRAHGALVQVPRCPIRGGGSADRVRGPRHRGPARNGRHLPARFLRSRPGRAGRHRRFCRRGAGGGVQRAFAPDRETPELSHWNYSGHRTVAEALTPALSRIGTESTSD